MRRLVICGILLLLPIVSEGFDLRMCLDHARGENPDLAVVKLGVERGEAQVAVAEASSGLTVDGSAWGRVVSVVPEMVQQSRELDTPMGPIEIPGGTTTLGDNDSYSMDIAVNKVIYAGGRLQGGVDLAWQQRDMAGEDVAIYRQNLDRQVSDAYISLVRLQALQKVAKASLDLAGNHVSDIQNMVDAGVVTSNEVLKAKLRTSEAEAMLIERTHQVELVVERIRKLTAWNFPFPESAPGLSMAMREVPNKEAMVADALSSRPELRRIDQQKGVFQKQLNLIQRERRPVITAFGQMSYGKPGPDFIKNDWIDSYSAGVRCNINIWDSGRISSREGTLRMDIKRLDVQRKALEAGLRLEVLQAVTAIKDAMARLTVSERSQATAEENFRITADRFAEGTLTNTDFLDAEITLANTRTQKVVAETSLAGSWLTLWIVTGKDLLKEGIL